MCREANSELKVAGRKQTFFCGIAESPICGLSMPSRPPLHRAPGHLGDAQQRRDFDFRRGSARQRGYTAAWDKARKAFLAEHPLCAFCERDGVVMAATVVDHIEQHHGDHKLFWNPENWQALCKRHHDSTKQRLERSRPRGGGQKSTILIAGPVGPQNFYAREIR